jgi:hypothetical protein
MLLPTADVLRHVNVFDDRGCLSRAGIAEAVIDGQPASFTDGPGLTPRLRLEALIRKF